MLIAILAGLGALIFFERLHTYDEPFERDIAIYAVIGQGLLHGHSLYSDLWDHKPPAIYATYAAAEAITGYGRDAIFLLNVVVGIVAMIACYFAGRAGGGRLGGIVAAILWTLASGDVALQGNQPNTELFLNALLAAGFALVISWERRSSKTVVCWAGLVFGVASLYKPVVIAQAGLLAFVHLICSRAGTRRKALGDVGLVGAIGGLAWTILFGYFWMTGRSEIFRETVFTYNQYYSGNVWNNVSQLLSPPNVSPDVLSVLVPMGVLTFAGTVVGLVTGSRRRWFLMITFCVATQVSVLLPGRSFPHYYQLWFTPLVIGAGWSVALLKRVLPAQLSPLALATAGVICAVVAVIELPSYGTSSEGWSTEKYGSIFLNTDRLALQLKALMSSNETFYEWGNESSLYLTTQQTPLSGVIFAYPVLRGPLVEELSKRLLQDLINAKPDLVVVECWTLSQSQKHPVTNWITANYRPFAAMDRFVLWARTGSALDQRHHTIVSKRVPN